MTAILNDSPLDSNVDIDKTLIDKAKKNQMTKTNVKNLIKVIYVFFLYIVLLLPNIFCLQFIVLLSLYNNVKTFDYT